MNEASLLFLLTGPYALAPWAILSLCFRRECVLLWEGGQNVLFMLCQPKGGEEKIDEILPDIVVDSLPPFLESPMLGLDEVPSCVDGTL